MSEKKVEVPEEKNSGHKGVGLAARRLLSSRSTGFSPTFLCYVEPQRNRK